ncbi:MULTISPECIES: alpha/beta fold hydrolase [Halorhodospira]|uniref:alpha/beta fold hydrolase n=1 Tax=Halorhodospira TaxID=85108 RepID=UPI001EE8A3F0|nr:MULTISPECIES: alpha/beta fold hydrolase [Halorhodospira]MCG5527365.1 alpha/beta fold hydrolase [Halorhodospira halophila]MCG5541745.1 alpha/beta fold hydrolase [Halorhodospira sp. M39old]MCG5543641.1 alpha/beta fold hydrolase [Halorhodospira sp. 9628]MCG5546727.1 alpha/beta fold hydrolase [Halorhodospira sp. M38]
MAESPPGSGLTDWQRRLIETLEQGAELPVDTRGATPFTLHAEPGPGMHLRRYAPARSTGQRPVLIVYSLVNRPFILDLTERRSLIAALTRAGHPVYLLDWGYPKGADRFLGLADYIDEFLAAAAAEVATSEGASPDLLGVCQGGVFALCLAALQPHRVHRLVNLVTPVDFHTPGDNLSRMAQEVDFDQATQTLGNISAEWLNGVFVALKPYRLLAQRYMDLPELAGHPEALHDFLRLERWMYDSPDQAATAFAEFGRECYQRNGLLRGTLTLNGRPVHLGNIEHPTLNVYAEQDHLVPADAARALRDHIGSTDYGELAFPGGHLGVFISRRAHAELLPRIVAWLAE